MDIRKELANIGEQLDHVRHEIAKEEEQKQHKRIKKRLNRIHDKIESNEPINVEGIKVRITRFEEENFSEDICFTLGCYAIGVEE